MNVTLVPPSGPAQVIDAIAEGDALWIPAGRLQPAVGFELKPDGFCKGDVCYPVPPGHEAEYVRDGQVNLAALWRRRGGHVAHTGTGDTWVLGDASDDQQARLLSAEAPSFSLPDVDGNMHSLGDYRGKKVLLATWASWCGCRVDLTAWRRLTDEVGDKLTVIAVALDSEPGAPDPWIEKAEPNYPVLIDREHHIAELYNFVNVPQCTWIDEEGHIVRPPETAGYFDSINNRRPGDADRDAQIAEVGRDVRRRYFGAIKDWVEKGPASEFVFDRDEVRSRLAGPDPSVAEAHVNFRLGQVLIAAGRADEAQTYLDRAKFLHPESWAMFRQVATKLEDGPLAGLAAGPDFRERVSKRQAENKPYYAAIEMEGMPSASL